jgi:hypothetical protein
MIPRRVIFWIIFLLLIAAAIGIYAWQMRERVPAEAPLADARPVPPPAAGPTEHVTLYVAHDEPGSLFVQPAAIPLPEGRQQRAQELLRSLLSIYLAKSSPHPLAPDADVRSVYLIDPGIAVIDLSSSFAQGHRSGILVEELTVVSMIQTLSENVGGITRVKILVDGKQAETLAGHVDLTNFFDVAAVAQLAAELQQK